MVLQYKKENKQDKVKHKSTPKKEKIHFCSMQVSLKKYLFQRHVDREFRE